MKLMQLHYKYFWNKGNIFVLGLLLFGLGCGFALIGGVGQSRFERILLGNNYLVNYIQGSLLLVKTTYILMTSYLLGWAFLPQNDAYNILYLAFVSRLYCYLTKVLVLIGQLALIGLLSYFLFWGVGRLLYPYFNFGRDFFSFLKAVALGLLYGVIAVPCVLGIKSGLAALLPFMLHFLAELGMTLTLPLGKVINFFLPAWEEGGSRLFSLDLRHVGLLFLFYGLVGGIGYLKQDFSF